MFERWLTVELERHAIRVDKLGWRDTVTRRRVSAEQIQRVYRWALRDIAPIADEIRRLGSTLPTEAIDAALFRIGRGEVAAGEAAAAVLQSVRARSRAT